MARKYDIDRSGVTGWWVWSCNDASAGGSEPTKRAARSAAVAACGSSFAMSPPDIDAVAVRGHLATFTARNLDGEKVTFSAAEISQETFLYVVGMDCAEPKLLRRCDTVTAILKIWGIYRGGGTDEAIRERHSLSAAQYDRLATLKLKGMRLLLEDDGSLQWTSAPDKR